MSSMGTAGAPAAARAPVASVSLLTSPSVVRLLSVVVLILVWEVLGRQAPSFASYPSEILAAFVQLTFIDDRIVPAFAMTFQGLAVGFVIAAGLGVPIGLAMGRIRIVETILDPYVSALYATPRIAMIPLLVLWAGIGFELRITVVVLSAIFPIIITTYLGTLNVDREFIETGRAFTANRLQMLRTVVIPASLPYIFAGLRIGMAKALIGVIVAEMTAAVAGTGALIIAFGRFFQTDRLFVPVILLGLLSILLARLVLAVQHRVTPWAEDRRIR